MKLTDKQKREKRSCKVCGENKLQKQFGLRMRTCRMCAGVVKADVIAEDLEKWRKLMSWKIPEMMR